MKKTLSVVLSLAILANSLLYPFAIAYAQEGTPTPEPAPVIEETVAPSPEPTATAEPTLVPTETTTTIPTNTATPTPTQSPSQWTFEKVELNKEYVSPQNSGVKLIFTKLPTPAGNIKIEEITLTPDQIQQTGSLSDKAYDITSDMADGSFTYNLSLPIPDSSKGKSVEVKFAEELSNIASAEKVDNSLTKTDTSISVASLDHFTIFVVTNSSPPPANHLQDIVDNSDSGFEIISGVWRTSTSVSGYYGSNYETTDNHTGIGQVRWNFTPTQSGTQEIFARWTAAANRGTAVPFTVTHDSGSTTVPVNEELNNSTWMSLGTYSFTAGNPYSVTLTNNSTNTNDFVVGDAIKLQNVSDPTEVWVDDSWAGTSTGTDLGSGKIFGYSAFSTIQDAIIAVATDGTINVAAGTYDEQIVIDGKDINLQGVGDTTVIQPSAPTILTSTYLFPAGNFWAGATTSTIVLVKNTGAVTLKDFKVDGIGVSSLPTTGSPSRLVGVLYGVSSGTIDNVTVDNIKTTSYADRTYGIQVSGASTGTYSVEVKNSHVNDWARNGIVADGINLTANINHNTLVGPGTISGQVANGILFIGGATGNATLNTINGMHHNASTSRTAGILVYGSNTTGILIDQNEVYDTDDGIDLSNNSQNATVSNNNLHNNLEVGIQLEDGTANNTITGNTIVNNTMAGIRFGGAGDPVPAEADTPPGAGNVANNNTITGNGKGVVNYDTGLGQIFDATNNWWGNVSGPLDSKTLPGTPNYNNPSGTGNSVTSYVDYKPWFKDVEMTTLSNVAPAVPTLVNPNDGAFVKPVGLTLDWSDITDLSTPVTYVYQSSFSSAVGANNALASPIYTSGILSVSEIDASGTGDGTYYWQARACDNLNNCSDWSGPWAVTVDSISPSSSFTDDASLISVQSDSIAIIVSDTNPDPATYGYGFSSDSVCNASDTFGNAFTSGTPFTLNTENNNGKYICARASDLAGNTSYLASSNPLNIDVTAPTVSGTPTSDVSSPTASTVITWVWTAASDTISGVKQYLWELWNSTVQVLSGTTTGTSISTSSLTDESYTMKVTTEDNAGNQSGQVLSSSVIVDTTNPNLPTFVSSSHTPSVWSSDRTINISWTATDPAPGSGIGGYSYQWSTNSTTVPDMISEGTSTTTISGNRATSQSIYFHVRAVDGLGHWGSTFHYGPFWVDANAPAGSWVTPLDTDYLRSTVDLEISPNDVGSGVQDVVFKIKKTGGSFTTISTDTTNPYQGSLDTTTKTNGTYVLRAQIFDNVNRSINKDITVTIDNIAPILNSVNIASNNANTSFAKVGDIVTLHFFSNEPIKPPTVLIAGHNVSATNNLPDNGNEWTANWQMVDGDSEGSIGFSIDYVDAANNVGTTVTGTTDESTVVFDKIAPTDGSLSINSDNVYTNSRDVNLTISATDNLSGINQMSIANSSSYQDWESYSTSKTWQLPDSDGEKTVRAKFKDVAGNVTPTPFVSDTIILDRVMPTSQPTSPVAGYYNVWDGVVSGTADDDRSGVNKVEVSVKVVTPSDETKYWDGDSWEIGQTWQATTGTTNWSYTIASPIEGTYTFYSRATDNAGNIESTGELSGVVYDITNPDLTWTSPTEDFVISGTLVILTVETDNLSGVDSVVYEYKRNNGLDTYHVTDSNWDTTDLVLDTYTLRATVKDKADNEFVTTRQVAVSAVVSSESGVSSTYGTATITWTTDRPTKSRVVYDTVSHESLDVAPNYGYAYSTGTFDSDPKTTSHTVTITGLSDGTVYYYRTISEGSPAAIGDQKSYRTLTIAGSASSSSGGATDGQVQGVSTVSSGNSLSYNFNQNQSNRNEEVLGTETQSEELSTPKPTLKPEVKGTAAKNWNIRNILLISFGSLLIIIALLLLRRKNQK